MITECWNCTHQNTQTCEGCKDGYLDYIDGWVVFDTPTHFEPIDNKE